MTEKSQSTKSDEVQVKADTALPKTQSENEPEWIIGPEPGVRVELNVVSEASKVDAKVIETLASAMEKIQKSEIENQPKVCDMAPPITCFPFCPALSTCGEFGGRCPRLRQCGIYGCKTYGAI